MLYSFKRWVFSMSTNLSPKRIFLVDSQLKPSKGPFIFIIFIYFNEYLISLNFIIYIDISMIDGIPSNFSCWRSLNSYWIFDIFMYYDVCISTEDHRNCFFFLGQCSVVIMEDNHKESWNKVSLCFATLINKNKIKKMSFSLTLLLFNS